MSQQEFRLELAKRHAAAYAADANVRAIVLVGSVPQNRVTPYSDIDMLLMYDGMMDYERLKATCIAHGGQRRKLMNQSDESCLEIYYVNGIECQFSHAPVSFYTQQVDALLHEHSLEAMPHLVADGLVHCLVLHGESFICELREQLLPMPDELAQAMVRKYLRPLPAGEMRYRIMTEQDLLRFEGVVVKTLDSLLRSLLGLNGQYMPGEWKKLDLLTGRLRLAPANLLERMNTAMQAEQYAALDILDALWRETVELVRVHMPAVDLAEAEQRLAYMPQAADIT